MDSFLVKSRGSWNNGKEFLKLNQQYELAAKFEIQRLMSWLNDLNRESETWSELDAEHKTPLECFYINYMYTS